MIEDKRVGDRPARAVWMYLADIRDKTEKSLAVQISIEKRLKDIQLYLRLITGFVCIAWVISLLLPRL